MKKQNFKVQFSALKRVVFNSFGSNFFDIYVNVTVAIKIFYCSWWILFKLKSKGSVKCFKFDPFQMLHYIKQKWGNYSFLISGQQQLQ